MYCNGWRSDTCANCVFIFGADGCTHICALNSPDALHDSSQYFYGNVCEKMLCLFETVSHSTDPRGNTSYIMRRKYIFSALLK